MNGIYTGLMGETEVKQNGSPEAFLDWQQIPLLLFSGFRSKLDGQPEEDELVVEQSKSFGIPVRLCSLTALLFCLWPYPPPSKTTDDKTSGPKKCETKSIVSSSISAYTL